MPWQWIVSLKCYVEIFWFCVCIRKNYCISVLQTEILGFCSSSLVVIQQSNTCNCAQQHRCICKVENWLFELPVEKSDWWVAFFSTDSYVSYWSVLCIVLTVAQHVSCVAACCSQLCPCRCVLAAEKLGQLVVVVVILVYRGPCKSVCCTLLYFIYLCYLHVICTAKI